MQKNRRKLIIAIYVAVAIYVLPMYPHGGSANELTRWATAASLVEKGSFDIRWTESLIGPNVDTAKIGDSTFSNKPPGVAMLAIPIYAATRLFVGPPDASNIRVSWYSMRLAASTLPLLLLALWLYRQGTGELGLAALLFATPLFAYSLLLFSHVLAGVLVYVAFRMLFDEATGVVRRDIVAGSACGFAVLCEFPAVFVVAVFGSALLFSDERLRRLGYFALGGLPFLIFLLFYNASLFGSPFSFSYAHESFPEWAQVASRGFLGIGVPTLENIYLLLISPARGLFFYSPILLLCVIDFFRSPERSTVRHRVKVIAVTVGVVLLCGHGAAHGGWGFGARYLVFLIPLLLDSLVREELSPVPDAVRGILLAVSIVFCALPALTFPFSPPEFAVPQNDFWTPLLLDERWFAPTLANVVGASSSLWTIVPVIVGLVGVAGIVMAAARIRSRFAVGLFVGFALSLSVILLPGLDSTEDTFRRATIAERFFRPGKRLVGFRQNALAASDWPAVRRINDSEWNIADTRSYAPDDFPYLEARQMESSPTAIMRAAIDSQQRGDMKTAERLLTEGKEKFDFARCEFTGNLAVIYYLTTQRERALAQLESIQPLVNPGSRPDCIRTQFLLGSLYRETSRDTDADNAFRQFLQNSAGSTDPELLGFRQQLSQLN